MFSKSLLATLSLLALTASSALAAPPLQCPAPSTVTVVTSGSSAVASSVAVSSSSVVSSAAASSTSTSSTKSKAGKDKDGKHKGGNHHDKGDTTSLVASSTDAISDSSPTALSNIAVSSSAAVSGTAAASPSAITSDTASATSTSASGSAGKGGDKGIGGSGLSSSAVASATAPPASSTSGTSTSGDDEQSATTLNPAVIATGFALDGQQVPAPGQVASLTSKNNFINFCLTVNKPITNGQQIKTGSCNPAPMGVIAATTNMPSSKFQFPKNGDTSIKANQEFTIQMGINNIQTGNFVNAASNYYSAPQQVNSAGNIIGHSHVVIEQLSSLGQTTTTDPNKFAFFKGINGAAVNGVVTVDVTDGLPAGAYRLASINAAANHQPVLVAVAQHGSLDDMVYFTVQ